MDINVRRIAGQVSQERETDMKTFKFASLSLLLFTFATPGLAVICESAEDDRYMDLVPDSGAVNCFMSGSTPPSEQSVHTGLGLTLLQESNENESGAYFSISGVGSTSGELSILDSGIYDDWSDVYASFKYGNGGSEPDWISYSLSDVFSADWSVFEAEGSSVNALSHVSLYGGDEPSEIPAPASLGLLGIGLLAITVIVRRRRV